MKSEACEPPHHEINDEKHNSID